MNGKLYFGPVNGYTREATTQLEKQGVCEDLGAKTLELSSFGDQFQFKDTEACHTLVWNHHCLSWVAATFQRAIDGVNVSCAITTGDAPVPLPPCRLLYVEVADKCVYSHFYRTYLENVCGNVPSPKEAGGLRQGAVGVRPKHYVLALLNPRIRGAESACAPLVAVAVVASAALFANRCVAVFEFLLTN